MYLEIPNAVLLRAKLRAKNKNAIENQFKGLDKEDPLYEINKEALMYNILTDILLPYFKRKVSPTIATIRKSMEEEQKQAEIIA